MMTNLNLTDMETGYKVFRREIFNKITIEEDRFGFEPEITAKIAKLKCRIYEIPIAYHGRDYSEGKKITWRDGFAALYCITKYNLLNSSRSSSVTRSFWLLLLVAIALLNISELKRITGSFPGASKDGAFLQDQRLQQLREMLPKAGQVGYVSDAPPFDSVKYPEVVTKYYMTQYALAPLVVSPGAEGEFIIGNFHNTSLVANQTAGLKLVKDFGGGLMLLRKKNE